MYFVTSLCFLFIGGLEALIIRAQLWRPEQALVSAETYNQLFTMHGTTMVFMVAMPMAVAFFNYVVPLQIGARDVAFPRLNALSYWLYLFGSLFMNVSWLKGTAPDAGWTGYANLTSIQYSPGMNVSYWVVGLSILGISSILGGVNFITTIVNLRAPGMKLMRMPLFTWMTLVTSFILVTAIPVIAVALVLLTFDRFFAANFFVPGAGGDPVLWQHLFWIFGHPEVYILILPSFGVISDVIPTFSRKPLFGYPVVVYAGVLIGFIGWGVWSHHMFAAGLGPIADSFFLASTMIIAIPTAMKIFNWLATMWGGALRYTSAMLFAVGWHLPAAYDLALKHHSVHIVQHLMFISVAVMMWWPVVAPAPELERIPDGPLLMLYVFAFGIPMTILSAFLTMSDRLIYPYYALAPRVTSLGPLEDQQLGGLLMWIPGMLIFWVAITAIWFRWTREEYQEWRREAREFAARP